MYRGLIPLLILLKCQKSKEIIFTDRGTQNKSVALPTPCLCINQVHSLTALGVVLNDKLTCRPRQFTVSLMLEFTVRDASSPQSRTPSNVTY